ncbi:MAG: carbon-nitrogen family hydrolase [Phycisphaerae bacterium]
MNVIGIQLDIVWENKIANFEKVRSLLGAAKVEPGSLVVLPEMFATGYSKNLSAVVDDNARPTERFLAEIAKQFGVYILAGMVAYSESEKASNQAIVFDPQGRELIRYNKLHPFSYENEGDYYAPGDNIVTFDWAGFTVAPFVCYDLRFPEIFRQAVRQGVTLFVIIANWPKAREMHFKTLLAARAIENQAYVIGVNRCGHTPKLTYAGHSMVIDPRGQALIDAGETETLIQTVLNLDYLNTYRQEFPVLRDIRPEFFP